MKKLIIISVVAFGMIASTQVASKSAQSIPVGMDTTFTDTVKIGDNAWGLSEKNFGTGVEWRRIIDLNPFLQEPGRVWYDHNKKMWFCMIHPGEILNKPASIEPLPILTPDYSKDSVVNHEINLIQEYFWMWMIILIGISFFILWVILKGIRDMKIRKMNPVTAGEPQVQGGVDDRRARARIQSIASQQFPSANIVIKNIRRGKLSGDAVVYYNENTHHSLWDKLVSIFYGESLNTKRIKLNDVDGYAGEIIVNDTEQTIYFLQGCGNDARNGHYMTGLSFIPEATINEDGSSTPVVESQKEVVTDELKDQKSDMTSVTGSENHQRAMCVIGIIEKNMVENRKEKHKCSFKLNTDGSIEYSVDYRYDNSKAPQKEKKEEPKNT